MAPGTRQYRGGDRAWGWTVPTLATGAALPMPFRPQAVDGTTYASGTVIPYGTQLKRLNIAVGLENTVTGLSLQTDPGSPAAARDLGGARACWRLVRCRRRCAWPRARYRRGRPARCRRRRRARRRRQPHAQRPGLQRRLGGNLLQRAAHGHRQPRPAAGGSFSEATPYGVYTAGTQSAPLRTADGRNPTILPRASAAARPRRGTRARRRPAADGATGRDRQYPDRGQHAALRRQQPDQQLAVALGRRRDQPLIRPRGGSTSAPWQRPIPTVPPLG